MAKTPGFTQALLLLILALLLGIATFAISQKTGFFNRAATSTTPALTKRIQLLIFNPVISTASGQRLVDYQHWNNPDTLTSQIISDFKDISGGFVDYQIAERVEINDFGQKIDGFNYTAGSYLQCWQNHALCHNPDLVNYHKILTTYQSCEKRNSGQIDEVWLWGGPWFGYYESTLTGPSAFWYNSPPLTGTTCQKLLPVMGLNYERLVTLEDFGHRIESVMSHVYGGWDSKNGNTTFDLFTRRDIDSPGQARCGNMHFAPNSTSDYDWSNPRMVKSACDDWLSYPNLPTPPNFKDTNCNPWNCDGYLFHKWWMQHLPKSEGIGPDGKWNNWWKYIVDYDNASNSTVLTAGMYDDTNPGITYSGSWQTYTGSGPFNSTLHYSDTVNDKITIAFRGKTFAITYTKHPNRGPLKVTLDGNSLGEINQNGSNLEWQQIWKYSGSLPESNHVLVLENSGAGRTDIDAITIDPSSPPSHKECRSSACTSVPGAGNNSCETDNDCLPKPVGEGTYDDTSDSIIYDRPWALFQGTFPFYNSTVHYTTNPNSFAQLSFNGNQITLVYSLYPNRGQVAVTIDGAQKEIFDAYDPTGKFQQKKTYSNLGTGPHTIRITNLSKNPEKMYVDLDAFIVENVTPPSPLACTLAKQLAGVLGCEITTQSSTCTAVRQLITNLCQ